MEFRHFFGRTNEEQNSLIHGKKLAILGLSPNNSYFNRPNIRGQIQFAADNFDVVKIMIPSGPLVYNYIAQDHPHPDEEAIKRCIPLYSMAKQYSENFSNVGVLDWEKDVASHQAFKENISALTNLVRNEESNFSKDIRKQTEGVLGKYANIYKAMLFPVYEINLIISAPEMFNTLGATYIYKDKWEPLEKMIKGYYAIKAPNISFAVVN